jgi:signal peptidase
MRRSLWNLLGRGVSLATSGLVVLAAAVLVVFGLLPHTGRYQTASVLSGSMRPTLPEGSIVFITPLAPRDLRVGDVVMYQIPVEDRRVVAHRVVEILESGDHPVVRTKGDANAEADRWVARMDTGPLWQVRGAVPKAGYAVHALRHPVVRRVCVLGLPLLLCLIWLGEIWRPRRDKGTPGPQPALVDAGPVPA